MIFKDPEYPDHIDFDTIPIGDSLTVCLCGHLPVTEALIKALPKPKEDAIRMEGRIAARFIRR
jgi:hypothetical protein